MAVMQSRDNRTFIAGVDLSSAQFKFVTLESDGFVDLANSAGENAIGVCLAGGAAGAAVQTGADGTALAAATGDVVMGYALEAGVDGQIIAIELIQGGNIVA